MTSPSPDAGSTPDPVARRAASRSRTARLALVVAALVASVAAIVLALGADLGRPPRVLIGGSPLLGRAAPDFTLQDVDGRSVSLAEYRGRPVIVNFWATWCEPCKAEFPIFRAARERYADRGLEILGVIHDDGPEAARVFAESRGAEWPLLQDPQDLVYDAYGVLALPVSFYVDAEGVVRAVSFGPPPSGVLDEQLQKILPAAASAPGAGVGSGTVRT